MTYPCRVTAELNAYEQKQYLADKRAEAIEPLRRDWIADRVTELARDPKALYDVFYETDIDTVGLFVKLAAVFNAPRDEVGLCVTELREYIEDELYSRAEQECDDDPERFDEE